MKRSWPGILLTITRLACVLLIGSWTGSQPVSAQSLSPIIDPDYRAVVVPPNIAPLNFIVKEPGTQFSVRIQSVQGQEIHVSSKSPVIILPPRRWHDLLQANPGQEMQWRIAARQTDGQWRDFAVITNRIAREPVDGYLTYRLLHPQFSLYASGTMGIYQRDLATYQETTLFQIKERTWQSGTCMNCHTFCERKPYPMALHVRTSNHGLPMLLAHQGQITTVNRPMGYLAWHPQGDRIAFSMNKLSLFYHTVGESRDVFDATSDLGIFLVKSNTFTVPPAIAQKEWCETWPAWSPDGRFLYFCRAPLLPIEQFRQVKYDLLRVSYESEKDAWGTPEVLVSAKDTGLSSGQPTISPDGRYLLFCLSGYGNFPVYQTNSDLCLLDLQDPSRREYRRLECNSSQTDSWHCWSSNSRWIVFSSKRRDGLLSRPYLSFIDAEGHASKPILVPQKDPAFYDSFLKTYNRPEFVTGPVTVSPQAWLAAVFEPRNKITPTTTSPGQTTPPEPADYEGVRSSSAALGSPPQPPTVASDPHQ